MQELRIVPQELWEAAKARQTALNCKKPALWRTNRPYSICYPVFSNAGHVAAAMPR